MATILLSAAGAAIGGGFGGTVLGMSGAVIGRAVGATLGRAIDQRLLGSGSQAVQTGRVDRLRLSTSSEGEPVGKVWGRMRVSGQLIWSTRFFETRQIKKSGKGAPRVTSTSYSYSISLALALCEGEILRVGRIWADGIEIDRTTLTMRVYSGAEDQLPDPRIEAVEGVGQAPAYRGIAYVVFEDLSLTPFGNRIPQFTFEVVRAAQGDLIDDIPDLIRGIRAVALVPGTGEYALATSPAYFTTGSGATKVTRTVNENSPSGKTDFVTALEALEEELPNCESVSLVVSWFGDDLRCAQCSIKPKVETRDGDARNMPWTVSGVERASAEVLAQLDGKPVYGGTPTDASVMEAIRALRAAGKSITFYPFILMEQLAGNGRHDPWTGADEQPQLPWRGRITLSDAPGRDGSPERTLLANSEIGQFFGSVKPADFSWDENGVTFGGAPEWSFRRFVLHYATLCAAAGGVDAFCIGSELVALTQARGANDGFPTVEELRHLAADVRAILGAHCKIGYAADWSEFWGCQPYSGERYFHLDPLWADENVDFVGIDNYMPLSDWRDEDEHLDRSWGAIYNLDYLQANVAGGEGFDWYYASDAHRAAQIRTPIVDGAHGEDWIWRYKDIRAWWENPHHERTESGRSDQPTAWVPCSKPIWFTELGCAAVDKGTNQPNRFVDPKSSETGAPYFSDGRRDDLIQMQYLRATNAYWAKPENNPVSDLFNGPMVDMTRAHVWAWDTRPYPQFPTNLTLWSDGENYARGHWVSGRATNQPLSSVLAEICASCGLMDVDTSALYGVVRGFAEDGAVTGRGSLQALSLAYGFDAVEREGKLAFVMREGSLPIPVDLSEFVTEEDRPGLEALRAPEVEVAGRVRLTYVEADGDFEARAVEAVFPDVGATTSAESELPLAFSRAQAQGIAERWLTEARVARDGIRLVLPPSRGDLRPGDVVTLADAGHTCDYRIDRLERRGALEIEATRVEPGVYRPADEVEMVAPVRPFVAPTPVTSVFLDLPLVTGTENPYAPRLAVTAKAWPGSVAVYSASEDHGYGLNGLIAARATIGQTLTPLASAQPGVWDRGAPLRVQLASGEIEAADPVRVLNGANLLAIGDGSSGTWELLQFARAELVGKDTWDISLRLRGQVGTDAEMPDVWPSGSTIVLIDGAVEQIDLQPSVRNLARHYRIGPALRPYGDPSYSHEIEAFAGIGLRPLRPVHLEMKRDGDEWVFGWIRRTRLNGDSWDGLDVPLAEDRERYLVKVVCEGQLRREAFVNSAEWRYTPAERNQDQLTGVTEIRVAQVSDIFGAGPAAVMSVVE